VRCDSALDNVGLFTMTGRFGATASAMLVGLVARDFSTTPSRCATCLVYSVESRDRRCRQPIKQSQKVEVQIRGKLHLMLVPSR